MSESEDKSKEPQQHSSKNWDHESSFWKERKGSDKELRFGSTFQLIQY